MHDTYRFTTRDGRGVTAEFHSDCEILIVTTSEGKIGNLYLRRIEMEDGDLYLITNMYVEGPDGSGAYKNQGIMTHVLRTLKNIYGVHVVARYPDGLVYDDGSNLTQDAPCFIQRRVKDGLVSWFQEP